MLTLMKDCPYDSVVQSFVMLEVRFNGDYASGSAPSTVIYLNVLTVGSRKDFTEVVLKSGDDKLHIYVCPKPFQDEMGINFTKGDELAITGSKIKQETAEIILAREMVKGPDTLMFRDDKGKPVWDERTGK